ncbi:MAG: nucleotidyltransferase domain-containing protein, partial [Verrucomicrobiales bacterium]|nr:nucleotidyltransferase domain-containing protein [Verrucomicrobiales bacterium]
MPNHLDKVKAHAKKELPSARTKTRSQADLIKLYKRFLKIEEHRIKMLHNAGAGGFEICRKRSDLLDIVLKNLFSSALRELPENFDENVSLVAHGGYGRALLNPGSDIDLLFLTRDSGSKLDKRASEVIEKVLYMLWDVGFKVGHATRSVKESIKQANDDTQTKSAIMESRLITGDKKHFARFRREFRKHCIEGYKKEYLADRLGDIKSRYAKYSNTVYLQEPHVKNGLGALRDFHNITWIAYVERGTLDLRDLSKEGILSNRARRDLDRAHDFLLRVRNDLHYTEKRATDTLTLRLQGVVATNFNYPPDKDILRRCENFMRDYYSHTRNMSMHTTSLLERFKLEQEEDPSAGQRLVNFLTLRKPKIERFDGFMSKNGWLYPENSKVFEEDSNRLIRAYLHIQQRNLRMSPQLRQAIKRNWSLIDKPFRYRKTVFESFEAILCRKGEVAETLRIMHRSGFLGRYLPEFGALTCLVQHEFFHRYTADEHTLKCIDELDKLSDTENEKLTFYQGIFHKIEDPLPLYLALILHDAGRAANQDTHADVSVEIANRVCSRLSVRPDRRRLVNFLVDNHLTLYITATKKNIADPQVIEEFAHIVRNKHYLDMLLLHTYADTSGTNDDAWSGWKESLIRQLHYATSLYLEDRGAYDSRTKVPSKAVRERVTGKLPEDFSAEVAAHFELMP